MTYAVFTYPPRTVPAPKMTRGEHIRWTQQMPPEHPHPFRYVRDGISEGGIKVVAK